MATLPADRSKLALAQNNQVPSAVASSTKNINAITELYDTTDKLYGYVNQTLQGIYDANKFTRLGIINPKDAPFNAKGDGVTDDYAAFVALAVSLDGATGVHIIIPAGVYILSDRVIFNLSNSRITCFGTIKLKPGVVTPYGIITIGGDNIIVEGLSVDGNCANAIDEGAFGISSLLNISTNSENITITNSTLVNSMYSAVTYNGNSKNIVVDGVNFNNIGEHCYYASGGLNTDIAFKHLRVMNYGMYEDRDQTAPTGHGCYVIKSRGDTYGNNDDLVISNVKVDFDQTSQNAESVLESSYLSNVRFDQIDTVNAFNSIAIVNVTAAALNTNIYMNDIKSERILFGVPTNIIHVELHDSELFDITPTEFLQLSRTTNTIFNIHDGSSVQLSASFADTSDLVYEGCTFKHVSNSSFFVLNTSLTKDLIFNRNTFYGNSSSLDCFRLATSLVWGSNQIIFNACQLYGTFRRLFSYTEASNPDIKIAFFNCNVGTGVLVNAIGDNVKLINCNGVKLYGTTANRPASTSISKGFNYFDTTINKPIWWTGAVWEDATGTSV